MIKYKIHDFGELGSYSALNLEYNNTKHGVSIIELKYIKLKTMYSNTIATQQIRKLLTLTSKQYRHNIEQTIYLKKTLDKLDADYNKYLKIINKR